MSSYNFSRWKEDSEDLSNTALDGILSNPPNPLRMVFIIRKNLGMSAGKLAAQCAHGAGAITSLLHTHDVALLNKWHSEGMTKIALKVQSDDEFNKIVDEVQKSNIPFYKVVDAGKTQLDPGTPTVLTIGPAAKDALDPLVGSLKLY